MDRRDVAITHIGAIKVAAKKIGISLEEYLRRQGKGEKWCTVCRLWHSRSDFSCDSSRSDGLAPSCRVSKNAKVRSRYVSKPRPIVGRRYAMARNGDKKQARRRIDHLIRVGLLPRPNDVPCVDCGHIWLDGGVRHEYDHHLGYASEHHESVEPVCAGCHRRREWNGGKRGR